MPIPVIDLFAGPGGLGEGFSSVFDENGDRVFKTVLSIEMEKFAHQTLTLRSFYRQFRKGEAPEEYYQVLRGELKPEQLLELEKFEKESSKAKKEARNWKLGYDENSVNVDLLDGTIIDALDGTKDWVLTGGPPCQAYSIVGRSRLQRTVLSADEDVRVDLYKHYLRIIEKHRPSVFIMENVKGMLSAKAEKHHIFEKIMYDLRKPGYKIFSLIKSPDNNLFDEPEYKPHDFIIKAEDYGIPQTRHRVILLGIRDDFLNRQPETLQKNMKKIPIEEVLSDLPRIRSGLSKQENSWGEWRALVAAIENDGLLDYVDPKVAYEVGRSIENLRDPQKNTGSEYIKLRENSKSISYEQGWFYDPRLGGVCNHSSRGHMSSDIFRYMFVSAFGKVMGRSPKLNDFPPRLLPKHRNVEESLKKKTFTDRFRVQLKNEPSKTITSHISKDGHYFIHYDPTQCRSFTVREAARIQTFPDNYFFCGPRTAQFIQVGNAVPPLLAREIALKTRDLF